MEGFINESASLPRNREEELGMELEEYISKAVVLAEKLQVAEVL